MITKYTFIFFFCLYRIYVHNYLNCQKIYNFKYFIIYLVKKGILGFSVYAPLHCRKKIKKNNYQDRKMHTLKIMFRDQGIFSITRTKTSIRYAKENDREKTERRRERERKVEGDIKRGRER